jgi:7,8-dihydropterin-6-yl-methyl-4-(beta-D-ribofuranosyl)aminobenzene 5'-phosphate synthase
MEKQKQMRVTIVYDNEVYTPGLRSDWGFSCLVEKEGTPNILFDTGASGSILLYNMERLGLDPLSIGTVVISHAHYDHMGGLSGLLNTNNQVRVYLPESCAKPKGAKEVIMVKGPLEISDGVFSTGELKRIEQSLAVRTEKGIAVIAGCSHPSVESILESASQLGSVYALAGGLHGFSHFEAIRDLDLICPCHCTQYKSEIRSLYPEKYVSGGVGKVLTL